MTKRIVEHGYSVAELLLAIAVIAVVAAAAAPRTIVVHERRAVLVDITLELAGARGQTVSLNTRIRVGQRS